MKILQQISAVTLMNLRSLPRRLGTSLVIVIGIGGVVAVVVSVLAMVTGMLKTMQNAGRDDRAIVMRNGSTSESVSGLSRAAAQVIMDAPGVKHDAEGRPLASAEVLRAVKVFKKGNNAEANVIFRGVGAQASKVRPELKLIEGRMFRPAVNEVIVGKGAKAQYKNLQIGSQIDTRQAVWTVVGIFTSNGDAHESELLTDTETLMAAYKRDAYSSVTVLLKSPAQFGEFVDSLASNPTVSVDVNREREYFARQSQTVSKLLLVLAYVIGGIMAVGAVFGALNTMYSAVSSRVKEIATLRAIGFGPAAMVISVLVEALLLAVLGGLAGAFVAWLFLNGYSATTLATDGVQLIFDIAVTAQVVVIGLVWAACIGFIGGLFPAIRAVRRPVAAALRAL